MRLTVPLSMKGVQGRLTNATRLALAASPYDSVDALLEECVTTSIDALMRTHGALVWDAVGFDELRASVAAELEGDVLTVVRLVGDILAEARSIDRRITEPAPVAFGPALDDVAEQRGTLVYPGFVLATGRERLPDVLRYLQAITFRLDRLGDSVARDTARMAAVHAVDARFGAVLEAIPPGGPADAEITRIGWMIEELRVSLFAQPLGAAPGTSERAHPRRRRRDPVASSAGNRCDPLRERREKRSGTGRCPGIGRGSDRELAPVRFRWLVILLAAVATAPSRPRSPPRLPSARSSTGLVVPPAQRGGQ